MLPANNFKRILLGQNCIDIRLQMGKLLEQFGANVFLDGRLKLLGARDALLFVEPALKITEYYVWNTQL